MRLMRTLKRMRYLVLLLLGTGFFALFWTNEAQAAITYQSAGAVAYSAAGGATVAPAYPASVAEGDLLVLIVGMKPSTANSGSVTTPAGWIPITSLTGAGGYGGTLGGDTGNTNVFTFYTVAVGGETGTLTVSLTTNNVSWAQMYRLSNATRGWDVAGTTGSDATGGAAVSIAMSANPGVTAGDYILGAMVIPTDVSTPGQFSGEGLSQTGITFGAVTEISEPDSGNGNDIGGFTYRAPVSSGTASAAPTLTATAGGTTTNVRGPGVFIRVREVSFTPGPGRYAVASGNWNATTTWSSSCGGAAGASIPVAGADVTICNGFTVTLDTNSASLNSLTVQAGGTLRFGNNNTARTLTVTGSITNAGTLNVNAASNTTHSLVAGGDITNTGTFNLATDAGSLCNTTFNRNGSQNVSGAGATTRFNRITLNMGTTNANVLDISATNFSINPAAPTNFLTLTNGTFKFSTAGTITPFTAAPTISATQGFWLNNAGATVNNGDFDWTVSGTSDTARGLLRVSSGTLNLTASANSDLITGNFSDIVIEGGTINVGGVLRPALVADNVRFNMSGGTLTVAAAGAPGSYPFQMEAAASFTMSGGTIVIRNDGGNNGYQNLAATNNVTGGTLQIGDGSTAGGQIMGINSTVPVGNLLINSVNATGLLQTNSLTVNGNVTITAGTLNANNLNITLGGNWSRTGTFTPGTGTVTFNGTSAQGITGATTFYNLVINNATGVTANSNVTINGNFTNTAGFNAGTTTTTFSGTALQTLTGATTFYDLVFNNAAGFTLSNDMTASNALTLTNGVIATGTANTLIFSSTTTCSVTRTSGRVNGRMRKSFTSSQLTCDFEIGDATNYTPVNVSFASVSAGGTVTAKATATVPATDHPEIATAPLDAANLVNRYWMLAPGGGLTFSNATLTFTPIGGSPVDHDSTTNVGSYVIQRYEISGGSCDPADGGYTGAGSWNDTNEFCTACLAQTTTRIMVGDISTFGGICSHFVTGVPSISGFLREKELIYQRELYY